MSFSSSIRKTLTEKLALTNSPGNVVRQLKSSGASKPQIESALKNLNALKLEKASIEKQITGASASRYAFREAVVNALTRRLFYFPSSSVAGFYNYGTNGCSVKANVLAFWRQHFIFEEGVLEIDCSCVTPEVVLKADFMVKDEKTGTSYRADHLLKDHCKEKLDKDLSLTAEKAAELKHVLAVLDDLSSEELGAKIKEYGITAPDTKNPLSDPYPISRMFATSIAPGASPWYMRPETAHDIFANFKSLHSWSYKLPFAGAKIGQGFKKISPRQGLQILQEFNMAEIEHFVDPQDKSHPKFKEIAKLEFLMLPRDEQMSGQSAKKLQIGDAVSKKIVNNETLGYFMGRVYLFLTKLGIDRERLRFRQHLPNEMAHYAADSDCWAAEIESSYGWIECVGIADMSAYDLKAHSIKSGTPLVTKEKFSEPREVEKLVVAPVKKELGLAFGGNQKIIVKALEGMEEKEAMEMKATLESNSEVEFFVPNLRKAVTIKKSMVAISKEKKKEHQRVFTPAVIEPGFGIERIIYCLYEHSFYTRPGQAGDEQLNVFGFPPRVAPIKCTIFPLVQNEQYENVAKIISKSLQEARVSYKIDITGTSLEKKYAITDEIGVPLTITVDKTTCVTIRDRDSRDQVRVDVEKVASVVKEVADGLKTWNEVLNEYKLHSAGDPI